MKGADLGFGGPTGGLLFLPKWKVRVPGLRYRQRRGRPVDRLKSP